MDIGSTRDTHTLRLKRRGGGGALLRFFLFGGPLLDAILLISKAAFVVVLSVILVALNRSVGIENNIREYMRTESSAS